MTKSKKKYVVTECWKENIRKKEKWNLSERYGKERNVDRKKNNV